jgi:enamine deaminase RidA (YjgF/YER057c/UK114 family)
VHKSLSPSSIHPPFAPYSPGIEVSSRSRFVFVSGQLGIDKEGAIPPDAAGQSRVAFDNISAILAEAGMGLKDVVKLNAYVTGRQHMRGYMDVRNALFEEPYPASTLMIVGGFTREEFVVEIEAIAASPG